MRPHDYGCFCQISSSTRRVRSRDGCAAAMRRTLSRRGVGFLVTLLGVMGFSAKAVFTKLAYPYGVDPITLMTLRTLVAVPVLWVLLVAANESAPALDANGWWRMLWAGLSGYYLAAFLDFYGLQTVAAILERIVIFLYPCFVVMLGAIWMRRRLSLATWLSMLLAYSGVVVTVVAGGPEQIQGDWFGLALIFLGSVIFATYYLAAGHLARRLGALHFATYLMTIAGVATLTHFLLTRPAATLLAQPLPVYWLALGLGVVSTVLPIILIAEGLRRIDTASSAAINLLGPLFTVALAYAFLGEALRPWQWLGFGMVLVGVFALGRSFRPSASARAPITE
ncbi:MAG: DMT family transporter [Algiphilus sp.]